MNAPGGLSVLVLCTANVCRSPVAQAELEARLDPALFRIQSAGLNAIDGQERDPLTVRRIQALGGDTRTRSRAVTLDLVRTADLILTMTVAQRGKLVELAPERVRSAFTLRELELVARRLLADTDTLHQVRDLVGAFAVHRGEAVARSSRDLDIRDPTGRRARDYETAFEAIRVSCDAISTLFERVDPAHLVPVSRGG